MKIRIFSPLEFAEKIEINKENSNISYNKPRDYSNALIPNSQEDNLSRYQSSSELGNRYINSRNSLNSNLNYQTSPNQNYRFN